MDIPPWDGDPEELYLRLLEGLKRPEPPETLQEESALRIYLGLTETE